MSSTPGPKSEISSALYKHFLDEFHKVGKISVIPAKTMIGISTSRKRIAYVTQFGKSFIHVVFPFETTYSENLCFQKIVQVPGATKQFNHHFRMLAKEDVNAEVKKFMRLAYELGS